MNVDRSHREQAGPEMLRGVDGSLDSVGMEGHKISVGGVIACQQSLLSEPEAVVAAEHGLKPFAVGSENALINGEVWKGFHGELIEIRIGCDGGTHTMPAEDDYLFELSVVHSLSCEKWGADERERKKDFHV